MKIAAALFACSLLMVTAALAQPTDTAMVKAVEGFYRAYETFRPPDGIPSDRVRKRFEPYISPSLDRLLLASEAAEIRYEQVTKGQYPPLVEGDLFTPNFEGATSFTVGPCEADARGGHCAVALQYSGGEKPVNWTDLVSLVRTPSGWRVDDISYGGNWDARGKLSDTLKSAIEHGNGVRE